MYKGNICRYIGMYLKLYDWFGHQSISNEVLDVLPTTVCRKRRMGGGVPTSYRNEL